MSGILLADHTSKLSHYHSTKASRSKNSRYCGASFAFQIDTSVYPIAVRLALSAVIASAAAGGIWSIQAGMFPENTASLALHESLGFRLVGRFERIAQLDDVWRDTVLLELRL